MKYQEFLDYIYQRHSGNVKLGLERMLKILEQMDNPNKKVNGIHIAGTNGKGSVAAICEALSIGSGLKTGLNTSPHLKDYRERIRLNGRNITFNKLMETYKRFEEIFEARTLFIFGGILFGSILSGSFVSEALARVYHLFTNGSLLFL